ncbi:uncharacterized protein N7483_004943 [Penicillium malachiteum]|uniref:uncharacterized protein n=1 Tax=Penicillium malachiteum TaxID=1324776 RepID=UPI002548C530|nr:uncharacterized protein N7483_004943 [Penicillium malachiteum]KAJ5730435.1 hypothetical protein N7483_004943 [Penicillium malachiteum]
MNGMPGTPDDKPQRATAAQLASRKIKDVRKRPRPTTAAPAAPGFSSGFTAPTDQPAGFSFGQSQSFPPSQPAQSNPAPFSFGGSSQPSFNFTGSSFGSTDSAPSTNPFASSSFGATIPPSSQPAQSTAFSFGGAGAGASQSTPQQTSFSSGVFGGQQNPSSTTASNLFGPSAANNSSANPVADSMQMSPDSKPKNSALNQTSFQNRNIFGNSDASSTPNVFAPKPSATPAVSTPSQAFGTSLPPTTTPSLTSAPSTIFGSSAINSISAATSTPAKPFGSLFQSTPSTSVPSESEKKDAPAMGATTGFSFTPVTSKPAEKEVNAGFSFTPVTSKLAEPKEVNTGFSFTPVTSKPAEPKEVKAAQDSTQPSPSLSSIFGSTPAASPNPFAPKPAEQSAPSNIFAPKPTEDTSSNKSSLPSASEKTAAAPTSLFGASASQPAVSSLFGSSSAQGSQSNIFGQSPVTNGSTAAPQKAFGNISSPKPAAEQKTSANIFAPKPASAETPAASASSSFNMFGQKPAVDQGSAKKESVGNMPPSTPASSAPGNAFSSEKAAEPAPVTYADGRPLNIFSTLNPGGPGAPTANPHNWTPKPGTYKAPVVNGKPYGDIPMPNFRDLSPELQDECELMWKVRTLDQSFKAQIAALEPGEHLFDNTILFYMRVRWSLGLPVQKRPEHMPPATHLYTHPEVPVPPKKQHPATAEVQANGNTNGTKTPATSSLFAKPSSVPTNKNDATAVSSPKPLNSAAPAPSDSAASSAAPKFAAPTTTPTFTPPAAPALPKFGSGSGGDFMAQFAKKAAQSAAAEKAKRKAEDFDSDEDDEEEWERRDAEEQEKKRAKIGVATGKKSVFVEGKGFQLVDDNESKLPMVAPAASTSMEKSPAATQSPAPSSAPSPAASIFESSSRPLTNSENIFGRITATPQPADDSKDSDASDDEDRPTLSKRQASEEASEDTEASKRTKTDDLFARIKSPAPTQESASATSKANPFGSINTSTSTSFGNNSLFAATPTAATPSMLAATSSPAPTPSVFSSTPAPVPSPFGASTFGASKPAANSTLFGASTSTPKPSMFGASTTTAPKSNLFGASTTPAPKSNLFGASTTPAPADNTWKPNSPIKFSGAETSENKTTENKTTENKPTETKPAEPTDEELGPGAYFNLAETAGGETGEESVFQCRARAFKLAKGKGWESQGTGFANLLVNQSGRARIVLRADPSGSIILNALLKKEIEYKFTNKNSVQFFVPQAGGDPEQWAIRVKVEIAQSFHEKVEAIKN